MAELEENGKRADRADSFSSGVIILSLSAVIVKIIGLIYKIPMLTLLGSEGMGYFNSAYEIYTLFCVIATAGLPVAMSVMISSARARGEGVGRIFKVSMSLFLMLGVIGTAIMVAFAMPFSRLIGGERAFWCILSIAPTIFFICLSSVYRGYFQGQGKMLPTAISQVIEAALKLVLGILFAFIALRSGFKTEIVAAFASLGLTLGVAVSALYLAVQKRIGRVQKRIDTAQRKIGRVQKRIGRGEARAADALTSEETNKSVLFSLLRTAIPITLSSAVISLTKIIDMTVILRRLQDTGYSSADAFSAYGSYTTLALPLFSLAPALIGSVALPLVPALSAAVSRGDGAEQGKVICNAIKLTLVVSAPISLGLSIFARPILELIFSGQDEAIDLASPLLSILGLSVTLSCLITVGNAVLQAYTKAALPVISMAAGSAIKLILAYFLIGNESIGIAGAPISTLACDATIVFINFYFIGKQYRGRISVLDAFIRPYAAAFISVAGARLVYSLLLRRLGYSPYITLAAIFIAAASYLPLSFAAGAIRLGELEGIPAVKKLINKIENKKYINKKKEEKICTVDLRVKKETKI